MKRSKLYYLTHPSVTLPALWAKFSDRYAIEQQWKNVMGYPLDLENPKTFNEKPTVVETLRPQPAIYYPC